MFIWLRKNNQYICYHCAHFWVPDDGIYSMHLSGHFFFFFLQDLKPSIKKWVCGNARTQINVKDVRRSHQLCYFFRSRCWKHSLGSHSKSFYALLPSCLTHYLCSFSQIIVWFILLLIVLNVFYLILKNTEESPSIQLTREKIGLVDLPWMSFFKNQIVWQ